jgi:hypothetical protein
MTRFKELKRIKAAIKNKDQLELQWAIGYCKMRLTIAGKADHEKYWRQMERTVAQALDEVLAGSR